MSRVALTGATGTIGVALAGALRARGDEVVALARNVERGRAVLGEDAEVHPWPDPKHSPPPLDALAGADAVVHLLGEPIAQRWTQGVKQEIRDSRVLGTSSLVAGLRAVPADQRPRTLISQSAAGFYGPTGDQPLDEHAPAGADFLAQVVLGWEREALTASAITRVVLTRTGVVLAPEGGALAKMVPFFRLGLGGPIAGGGQYMPWVHLEDVVEGLLFCIDHPSATGPVNLTAPNPVTNSEFSRMLGRVLGRPAVLPIPALGLRLLYGEMAQTVTGGQRVLPERLRELGFEFRHPRVEAALGDLLGRS